MTAPPSPHPHRLNLTALLALAATAELVLHRLVARLFLPEHPSQALARAFAAAGRFAFHLAGVLGLVVLVGVIATSARRRELFPRSMRVAVALIALLFVVLSAAGIVLGPLPERLALHERTSHALLAWFLILGLWRGAASIPSKIGVSLFALPAVLQGAAVIAQRAAGAQGVAQTLALAAERCALVAAVASPFLLVPGPLPPRRRLAGIAAGVLVLGGSIAALVAAFDLVKTLMLYAFSHELPAPSSFRAVARLALTVAAFVGLAVSLTWVLPERGSARLLGLGLLLITTAGYQAASPHQIVLSLCGLVAVVLAIRRHLSEGAPVPIGPVGPSVAAAPSTT